MNGAKRTRARLSGCGPIIAPNAGFSLSSLSTKSYMWNKESDWEDGEKAVFSAFHQVPPAVLFQPIPFLKTRRSNSPQRVGRWLLQDAKKAEAFGFVEVNAQFSSFNRVSIVLSPCRLAGGWESALGRGALSFFISGLIIMTKADVVTLIPANGAVQDELARLGLGEARSLWTPVLSLAIRRDPRPSVKVQTRDIDAVAWWEGAEEDKKALAYLEKRRHAEEAALKPPPRKARTMMDRLSGFLRWK